MVPHGHDLNVHAAIGAFDGGQQARIHCHGHDADARILNGESLIGQSERGR